MRSEQGPQAGIYVDENHSYTVSLGRQPIITWAQNKSLLTIRVHLPYDGQVLKDVRSMEPDLPLGHIEVTLGPGDTKALPISIPAGVELTGHLKSNKWMRLPRNLQIEHTRDTLIAVEGQIFDGASLDADQLRDLIFGHTGAFVQDLRLHLSFWVPDLFAKTEQSRARELREMLLQRETGRQIFIPAISEVDRLAESLAALANTSGGRILIGVDQHSQVVGLPAGDGPTRAEELKLALLNATLRCSPAVPFFAPDMFHTAEGKTVARVIVPQGVAGPYRIGGQIYRRIDAATVGGPAPSIQIPAPAMAAPVANLDDALKGESDDVIILDAGANLGALELGPAICGLINAGKRDGLILIRNLAPSSARTASIFSRGTGVLQQLEERARQELQKCLPRLTLRPALARANDEQIGVLRVTGEPAPVALYDGAAYDWEHRSLRSIGIQELFERYLQHQRTSETNHAGDRVQMVYGELDWPIQPPSPLPSAPNGVDLGDGVCAYNAQRQAMIWNTRGFKQQAGTAGWSCTLTAPLHRALMELGDSDDSIRAAAALQGHISIRLNDVLASGVKIQPHADNRLFDHLPVYKRTNLRLQFTADPQELFRRRRRMSLLRFRVPDVSLDTERVADVRQACADLGFRIANVDERRLPERALLEGVRNEGFCDIALLAGLLCERTPMTRELQYEQRTDSKVTQAAVLDIRIALWGSGDAAAATIARLHMDLHQLLHQRLYYLHTE